MKDEPSRAPRHEPQGTAGDNGVGRVFFDGLPMMVAIVTVVSRPFVQKATLTMLGLPLWFPHLLAIAVAALLSTCNIWLVRRAPVTEAAILMLVLTLVGFSAYATGNNVVDYANEGSTRADVADEPASEELASLRSERDVLDRRLQAARDVIGTLRRAIGPPGPRSSVPRSSRSSLHAVRRAVLVTDAHAQTARPQPPAPRTERPSMQQAEEALQKCDQQQRELDQELETLRERREQTRAPREQRRLLKSR